MTNSPPAVGDRYINTGSDAGRIVTVTRVWDLGDGYGPAVAYEWPANGPRTASSSSPLDTFLRAHEPTTNPVPGPAARLHGQQPEVVRQYTTPAQPDGQEPDCTCGSDDNTHDSGCATAARWYAEAATEVAHIEDDAAREEQQDRAITRRAHAAGDHQWCGVDCEVAMPSEAMRCFIVAKGYPGTAGALAELERRAARQAAARHDAEVRAAAYREAADLAESLRQFERVTGPRWSAQVSENVGVLRVAAALRARADAILAGTQQ